MDEKTRNEEKEDFIRKIIKTVPDMKVHFIDQVSGKKWASEKKITELSKEERKQFNLRRAFPSELILDIEDRSRMIEIRRKLEEKKWSYTEWLSGSRGIHCSILFSNLEDKPIEFRNRLRKYFISYFETDMALTKESQWIAQEYAPHFKTGKIKELTDTINSGIENKIELDVIEYIEDELKKQEERKIETKQIIENWKNDPYLDHALNNIIEGGNRNNILFKNLAILLVLGGLKREEILPYAEKIVSNCPRKNIGEFMGWADKSISGQLTEFNKSELQQWSVQRGEKPLYELESSEDITDLMTMKQLFDEIWKSKIICQDVWRDLCFYNLLGTVIDEKEDEYRIHVIFSSPSGTGKDEGVNLVGDILERLGYKTSQPGTITDRTLVGAVNQKAQEINTQYGLNEENPIKGKHEWKDPIEKGLLEYKDWIACSESEFIFKPSAYNKSIQSILRQAMDKRKVVEKGVTGQMIYIRTNTSFLLTTYPMDNIVSSILHNGLFQRCLYYNKYLTKEEHIKIREFINKSKPEPNKKCMMKLLERLRDMKKWYHEHKNLIKYEANSGDMKNKLWAKFEEEHETYFKEDRDILNSMVRRSSDVLSRLSYLNSISNMSEFVTHRQIKECFELTKSCLRSVKDLVMKQEKSKKRIYAILNFIAKGSVSKGVLSNEMDINLGVKSPNKRTEIIKELVTKKYIDIFKEGKSDMLYITEAGRNYLDFEE